MTHYLILSTKSPIDRCFSMNQEKTDITKCGHISYSWPGDPRIVPYILSESPPSSVENKTQNFNKEYQVLFLFMIFLIKKQLLPNPN